MSAAAFRASFNSRFACSVSVLGGREFDQLGQAHAIGGACAGCFGCDSRSGDMGVADTGFALERKHGQLHLSWTCPGCGKSVVEDTSLLSAADDAKMIAADAL